MPGPFVNHMNYRHLNVEVGPLFRRSLKFRPAPVGVRVRLESSGTDVAGDLGATRVSQVSSTEKVSPSHRITARSITFCNSRMLPGQSYAWNRSEVFLFMLRIFLPAFWA